jgi:fructose-specific PTS system IIA-like component
VNVEAPQAEEFAFECKLPNGLHARPASHLAEVANRFLSSASLTNLRNGATADIKSVLAAIAADVRPADPCVLRVEGPDQSGALNALRAFIADELPGCDEPLAEAAPAGSAAKLPRGLESSGTRYLCGLPASPGIAEGAAVILGHASLAAEAARIPTEAAAVEHARIERGFSGVRGRVEKLLARHSTGPESGILKAHLAILGDVTLRRQIAQAIDAGASAAQAIVDATGRFADLLHRAESVYIRERAADVQELGGELLEETYGAQFAPEPVQLRSPSVIVAETLSPHEVLGLDRSELKAIVLESAGATSHAMIVARSLGIPAVAGVSGATRNIPSGSHAIVDGNRGYVYPDSPAPVRRFYARDAAASRRRARALAQAAAGPASTVDGARIEIGANVSTAIEASAAFANGADGIGLFRTELFFAGRSSPPSEEEQYEAYAAAVRAAGGRPVILRTADIGGDKPLPYLKLPAERNPFLGYRGIRIYAEHSGLIETQLRAALRASAHGNVWMMAPMVATADEAVWFKRRVAQVKESLCAEGVAFQEKTPVGAMIEIPSAAFQLPRLAAELDFFSIGTNDLCQYFFAADREDSRLAEIASVRHPAFLALLERIAIDLRARGKWIGLCGEMAGDARNLPLLIGLGLDEISASTASVPTLKRAAGRLSAAICRETLARAMGLATPAEVEALLDAVAPAASTEPLLAVNLVTLQSDSADKPEAIRELVDSLYAAGRVEDRQRIEDALWAREAVYSTGLGHGFAIPHCKTDAVSADSIGILKLGRPIEWGSLDGEPVRMVILLALKESNRNGAHLKVFSRLARKLMDEEFRGRLMQIDDPGEMISHVGQELEDRASPPAVGETR